MRSIVGSTLLVLVLAGANSYSVAQCNTCPERRTIAVSGSGKVSADADLAIVRIDYKLYGADAKSANANATDTSKAIMKALTDSGIPRSAIESTSQVVQHAAQYESQQYYPVNSDEWRNHQFTVTQSWIIRVKPDDAAAALDTAIKAGANESGWIEWIVQNPGVLQAEAAAEAVADARTLAEQIVKKSNVQLGQLVSASETPAAASYPGMMSAVAGGLGMGTGFVDRVQVGNQQLTINSRRIEFSASVYATFAIE